MSTLKVGDLITAMLEYPMDADVWIDGELTLPSEVTRAGTAVVIR